MTAQHNEKSPAPAATGNEGNKSIRERSTATAYLSYNPDNTRHTFGTWGGDDLPMQGHVREPSMHHVMGTVLCVEEVDQ